MTVAATMKLMPSRFDGRCKATICQRGNPDYPVGEQIYWSNVSGSYTCHKACGEWMQGEANNGRSGSSNLPLPLPAGWNGAQPAPIPTPVAPIPGTPVASTTKSCDQCPSFVTASEAQQEWGAPINAATCKARGIVLHAPAATLEQRDAQYLERADRCPDWNDTVGGHPDHFESVVAISVKSVSGGVPAATCTDCKHYITPDKVMADYGWGAGACAGTGRLIFPEKLASEPLNCGMASAGTPDADTNSLLLLTMYQGQTAAASPSPIPGAAMPTGTAVKAFDLNEWREKHAVDPREYVSDRPVTPGEAAHYIRAWRIIEDPEQYGPPVEMPIFDGKKVAAAECEFKRPDDGEFCQNPVCGDHDPRDSYGNHKPWLYVDANADLYQLAVTLFTLDYSPMLIGPSGSGKTDRMCNIAYLMDVIFERIPITKGSEVYHLAGENSLDVDPTTGQAITKYKFGRFSKSYSRTRVICVDEANLQPDVWEFLRAPLDGAQTVMLDDAQGIKIRRGAGTVVAMTQNPAWDPVYVGAEPVSAADMQRIVPFYYDYPSPDIEQTIIIKHCKDAGFDIEHKVLNQILQISEDIRNQKDVLGVPWGIRSNIKVALFSQYLPLHTAFRRAVLDAYEEEVTEQIMNSINLVVGDPRGT